MSRVTGGKQAEERAREWVHYVVDLNDPTGSRELSKGVTSDWYLSKTHKKDGFVSIQDAYELEIKTKNALDNAFEYENLYSSEPGRVPGDVNAPCGVLKRMKWH